MCSLPDLLATEIVSCLCGSRAASREIVASDEITGALFTYVRCSNCGMFRLCPRPVLAEMQRFYPNDYPPYDAASHVSKRIEALKRLIYWTFWATSAERPLQVRLFRWLLVAVLAPLARHSILSFSPPAERRVFEFGAGSGRDLIVFREAGWEVAGCEPSDHARQIAARRGIMLQPCAAEAAELPMGMGCVYMNNVFEHLHDPLAVLAKSHAALLPNGVLVLIVPNHDSWAARLFQAAWPGYDPPRHTWGYTPQSIRMLLASAGFGVLSVSQRFPLSDHCWFSGIHGYRAPRVKGRPLRARAAHLLRPLLLPVSALAALCGHGDYIYVVARKIAN